MSTFTLRASPLPTNFRGTPQQLFEAIVDRLEVVSDSADFVISDNMPTSNSGPWLKGGTQWWVWDENTSTYVPLDVSASTNIKEIFVGDAAPDITVTNFPRVWLKTSGVTVIGLYYWFGDIAGWVTMPPELQPNSITNLMLQDNCIATRNVQNGAITVDKLPNNLPFTKFERGAHDQFLRMDQNGAFAVWESLLTESELTEFTTDTHQVITIAHGLGRRPDMVRVVLQCVEANNGFDGLDEVDMMNGGNTDLTSGSGAFYKANDTSVIVYLRGHFRLSGPPTWAFFTPDPAQWKIKVYAGKASSV